MFDDSAASSIVGQPVPFVGTFRPEQALSAFTGKTGADVNGNWRLIVADDAAGGLGTLRCWSLFISPTACTPAGGACELCPGVTITSALGTNSPQQTGRVLRLGVVSTCGAATSCPGVIVGNRSYDAYTFRNGPTNACITVTLSTPTGANLFCVAYTNAFNPASLCANYLADCGDSTIASIIFPSGPRTYSFNVPANALFVVTVSEVAAASGGEYTLSVTGGDCRPVLNITALAGSKALLDWTTAAAGYQLESTNALVTGGSPLWPPVTNVPVVINSRFNVTNSVAPSNQFYHLRKPLP